VHIEGNLGRRTSRAKLMVDAVFFRRHWQHAIATMRTPRAALLAVLALGLGACSLLLNEDPTQCSHDRDCASLGFTGWVCDTRQNVCVADPEPGHGGSSSAGSAGATNGGNPGGGKGGSESATSGSAGMSSAGNGGVAMGGSAGNGGGSPMAGSAGAGGGSPTPTCEATACQAASGTCVEDECVIVCNTADCKPVCPLGMPCRVECSNTACNQGVDCQLASSCQINCGENSCTKGVSCAGSSCGVTCSGQTSCSITPVVCNAKTCDIDCSGGQSCHQVQCGAQVESCTIGCGGVQACGTLVSSGADQTDVTCNGEDTCAGAKTLCCEDGVTCSGDNAPPCN
jgi:hypothetical protein